MQDMSKIIPNQPENMRKLGEELRKVSRPKKSTMVSQEVQLELVEEYMRAIIQPEYELLLPIAEAASTCVQQVSYGFGPDMEALRKAVLPWWQYQREQRKVAGR